MKRQPRILAGTAIGLLMASAPLGAVPLPGKQIDATPRTAPLILVQEECQGENCAAPGGNQQEQQAPAEQESPAQEEQQAPAEEPAPEPEPEAQPEAAPEPEPQPQAEPEQQEQPQAQPEQEAPAEEAPAAEEPAAEQPQAEPEATQAPAQEAPAEQAPAEEQRQEQAPAQEAPAEQPQTREAPAEQPSQEAPASEQPQAEQPSSEEPADGQAAPAAPESGEQPARQGQQQGEQPEAQPESAQPGGAQSGEAPADPNAAPVLDSQKQAAPAQPGAEQPAQQPAQTGEQPAQQGEQPARQGEQAAQPQAPAEQGPPPESDAAAQAAPPRSIQPLSAEEGQRIEVGTSREERQRFRQERRERRQDARVVQEFDDNRAIITINNQTFIDSDDDVRIIRDRDEVYYEELPRGRVREVITRPDGARVITIRNRYGDVVRRSRVGPDDREVILVYVDDQYENMDEWRDPGLDLPPMRLTIPQEEYILDAEYVDEPDAYYEFLEQPPVERVERTYSLNEVKRSARIRDKVRRIDMDTLTFEFGSASIAESEIAKLEGVANAMQRLLEKNPAETFLLEGHTDAVGSDTANLALSDRRAEAVAEALTNVFDIPPENLATQGYGEQYLKVNTEAREAENRRVAIRRVTPLVAPVASAE